MAILPLFHARRAALAIKLETDEGTAVVVAGADADMIVSDVRFSAKIDEHPREPVSHNLSSYASIFGGRQASISFKVELKGSGAAGTAPKLGKLLKLARMGETIAVGVSVVYDPIAVGVVTATVAVYSLPESGNNLRGQIRGARISSMRATVTKGGFLVFDVVLTGVYDGVTDQTALTGISPETTKPQPLLAAAFSVQGYAARISQWSLDLGLSGVMRDDMNNADGYVSYVNTEMQPTLEFDPERVLVATHDWYGKWISGAEGAFTVTAGAVAGNICTITGPKLQYVDVQDADRGKIATHGVKGRFNDSSGNDRIKFAFT